MIRILVRFGKWLDSRFPAKVTLTEASFDLLVSDLKHLQTKVDKLGDLDRRLALVETSAVHKGAVQDLVKVVAQLKEDYSSFKASSGFVPTHVSPEIQAMLNGEYIPSEEK